MLSRVADALYWMARYVERAEASCRLLEVTRRLQSDLGEVDPNGAEAQWQRTLRLLALDTETSIESAIFDAGLIGSVSSHVGRARENARQVQEAVSSEMWDYLNQTYWALEEATKSRTKRENLSAILADTMKASFLWAGVVDATIDRGPSWLFIHLGQAVERLDFTSRICMEHWTALEPKEDRSPTPGDNVGWLTWLRACGSLEAFRKRYPTRIEPDRVLDFLILSESYPRSIRYCALGAHDLSRRLMRHAPTRGRDPEREFGKLAAHVEYADTKEVRSVTPEAFLKTLVTQLNRAALETQRAYFMH